MEHFLFDSCFVFCEVISFFFGVVFCSFPFLCNSGRFFCCLLVMTVNAGDVWLNKGCNGVAFYSIIMINHQGKDELGLYNTFEDFLECSSNLRTGKVNHLSSHLLNWSAVCVFVFWIVLNRFPCSWCWNDKSNSFPMANFPPKKAEFQLQRGLLLHFDGRNSSHQWV